MKKLVYPADLLGTENDFNNIIKINLVKVEPADIVQSGTGSQNPADYDTGQQKGDRRRTLSQAYNDTPALAIKIPKIGQEFVDTLTGSTAAALNETARVGGAAARYVADRAQVVVNLSSESRRTHTEIYLPAPAMMPFSLRANYNQQSLGGFNNLSDTQFKTIVGGSWNQMMKGQMPEELMKLGQDILAPTVNEISGLGSDQIRGAVESRIRAVRNPHMKVLYDGPDFRSFSFTSALIPFEAMDSITIRDIIRAFTVSGSPDFANRYNGFLGTDNWFSYPDEMEIQILRKDPATGALEENPFVQKIRRCVLTSMEVSYGGTTVYATHSDGAPIDTTMTLSFMETEYITQSIAREDFYPNDKQTEAGTQQDGSTSVGTTSGRSGTAPSFPFNPASSPGPLPEG